MNAAQILIQSVIDDMEVWCNMLPTGLNVASQPSNEYVKEWRSKLQSALNYLNFLENKVQVCPTHGKVPNAWGCPECVRELRNELQKEEKKDG